MTAKDPGKSQEINRKIQKICVFGVGGVGGYFGGKIAKTISDSEGSGQEVYFIARGKHLDAIKSDGLTVITPKGAFVGRPTLATDRMEDIPEPDLVLIGVKGYDLEAAVKAVGMKVAKNTVLMPLLNGADIHERIRATLPDGIVLPACVYVGTHIQSPGVIRQGGRDGTILFGKDPGRPEFDPRQIINLFRQADIGCRWYDDPLPGIWEKYLFIASFALVTVYAGKSMGEVVQDADSKRLVVDVMEEIAAIAAAKQIPLQENIIEQTLERASGFPFETKTSYQRDVESKGRVNEGDLFGGTIIREGEKLGVPTPVTRRVYGEIQLRLGEKDPP